MARRKGAWPGFRQTGPIARASPERRTLTLMTRAPAPLGAPSRHRMAFAFHGSRTRRRLGTHGGLPESRPGTWLRATPAGAASRPTLMTPHESAPQWTRRAKQNTNFTVGQCENSNDDIVMIAAPNLPETPCESVCATRAIVVWLERQRDSTVPFGR